MNKQTAKKLTNNKSNGTFRLRKQQQKAINRGKMTFNYKEKEI